MAKHPKWTAKLFTEADLDAIARAVGAAEAATSAEIRVHLERRVPAAAGDAMARARAVFAALGMHRTAERNGVLIYLAVEDRKLAIVGDDGIHGKVGPQYWERVRDVMVHRLRAGAARDAVLAAVVDVGAVLQKFFARRPDDRNELSDDVSVQ
jgi:uncharacterized membrane protein